MKEEQWFFEIPARGAVNLYRVVRIGVPGPTFDLENEKRKTLRFVPEPSEVYRRPFAPAVLQRRLMADAIAKDFAQRTQLVDYTFTMGQSML